MANQQRFTQYSRLFSDRVAPRSTHERRGLKRDCGAILVVGLLLLALKLTGVLKTCTVYDPGTSGERVVCR